MQPSSLIFLVLIAIWAAYLLQHWVRRREYLATARSVDRFSDAMRVLERRRPPSELDLAPPRSRSYVFTPARPSPPEVAVKRAHFPRPDDSSDQAAVRPTRIFHVLARMSARRLRGLSLLATLALALLVLPLALFSVLSPWSLLVVVLLLFTDVAWLRHAALSERAKGREDGHRQGSADAAAARAVRGSTYGEAEPEPEFEPEAETETQAEFHFEAEAELGSELEAQSRTVAEQEPVLEPGAGVVVPSHVAEATPRIELTELTELTGPQEVEADLSGWAPVPVPPPTYTLKAKAAGPVSRPAVVPDPPATGPWSLDGMEYDCELDELVERRSATGA